MMNMLSGFKKFILRGNVVDLSVGVVVGAAFGTVVSSLVKGVITPLIGALGKVPDFSDLSFTINGSLFMIGDFINAIISFLIVASAVYFIVVVPVNALVARTKKEEKAEEPKTKKCPECLSDIPKEATRCSGCTIKLS